MSATGHYELNDKQKKVGAIYFNGSTTIFSCVNYNHRKTNKRNGMLSEAFLSTPVSLKVYSIAVAKLPEVTFHQRKQFSRRSNFEEV